jgi:hypothetical protein
MNEVFPWLASRYDSTGPQLSNGITLFQNWVLDYVYKFIISSADVAKLISSADVAKLQPVSTILLRMIYSS